MSNFIDKLNRIVEENTEFDSIDDLDSDSDPLTIESGSEVIMDLVIEKHPNEILVAQYVDGNASRPDPLVRFSRPDYTPTSLEDTLQYSTDTGEIEEFVNGMWGDNLIDQFC